MTPATAAGETAVRTERGSHEDGSHDALASSTVLRGSSTATVAGDSRAGA